MLIRSILTIAVLGSFVFGAAANATEQRLDTDRAGSSLTAQIDGILSNGAPTLRR